MDTVAPSLYGDTEPDYETEPEPIHADDPDRLTIANRHVRAIARLTERANRVAQVFKAEMDLLEERLGEQMSIIDRQLEWHQRPVVQLHEAMRRDDPRLRTLVLPHGQLKCTVPVKPSVTVTDRDAFTAWATLNKRDDLIATTVRPDVSAISAAIDLFPDGPVTPDRQQAIHDAHGERVPGVEMYLGGPRYRIVPVEAKGVDL